MDHGYHIDGSWHRRPLFSFIPCVGLFSILFTIPGIVLGTIALVKAVKNNTAGRGFAIVGLICSILGSVIFVVQCIVVNATADLLSKGPSSFLNDDDDDLKALKKSFKELDEAFKGLDTSDSDLDSSWGASSKGKKEKSFFDSALEAAQKKLERQLERELENANRELERENMELERELRDLN